MKNQPQIPCPRCDEDETVWFPASGDIQCLGCHLRFNKETAEIIQAKTQRVLDLTSEKFRLKQELNNVRTKYRQAMNGSSTIGRIGISTPSPKK